MMIMSKLPQQVTFGSLWGQRQGKVKHVLFDFLFLYTKAKLSWRSQSSFLHMDKEEDQNSMEPQKRLPKNAPPLPRQLGTSNPPAKTEWPELLDSTSEEAEKKIKEEMPDLRVHVVPADSFVTMDFNENRVRIFLDSSGKVARAPRIG